MKIIYLKEFIKTGFFASITIGSSKEELIETLGNKYHLGDCGEIQIIKYGWYEFFYWTETGKIHGIQNDHLPADCVNHDKMINYKNRKWKLDPWFLQVDKNVTFKEVKDYLNQANITYTIEPQSFAYRQNIIKCVNSKVAFDFASEYTLLERDNQGKFKGW